MAPPIPTIESRLRAATNPDPFVNGELDGENVFWDFAYTASFHIWVYHTGEPFKEARDWQPRLVKLYPKQITSLTVDNESYVDLAAVIEHFQAEKKNIGGHLIFVLGLWEEPVIQVAFDADRGFAILDS